MSPALIEWGLPHVAQYGTIKRREGEEEAKKYKAVVLKEFDAKTDLCNPMDTVHGGTFGADVTPSKLRVKFDSWLRNTAGQSWDSKPVLAARMALDPGQSAVADVPLATGEANPSADAVVRSQSAFELFAATHADAVKNRTDELLIELVNAEDSDSDANLDEKRAALRPKCWKQAAMELFAALPECEQEEYESQAADLRDALAKSKTSFDAVARKDSHRDLLLVELRSIMRRFPAGRYGLATAYVEVSWMDSETGTTHGYCADSVTTRGLSLGNGRYQRTKNKMWQLTQEGADAHDSFLQTSHLYLQDCQKVEKLQMEKGEISESEKSLGGRGNNGGEEPGKRQEEEEERDDDDDAETENQQKKGGKGRGNVREKSAEDADMEVEIEETGKKGGKGNKSTGGAKNAKGASSKRKRGEETEGDGSTKRGKKARMSDSAVVARRTRSKGAVSPEPGARRTSSRKRG
ncbi:hypothetical protein EXIGLDRAFT_701823 [Exidia glandulosa HHB12029]|uniref:Uncharacterized protein n=1 Tax=Exidia glandulosa HHB12029 TaxID=1314781 RepID=A0A165CVF2_EXIGL|nr:hypothetical protein EXIGLDRAFT_701823 [Exidia glandulosa HHB12029]